MTSKLLTIKQVAEELQYCVMTVRRMLERGSLAGERLGLRGHWRISEKALEDYRIQAARNGKTSVQLRQINGARQRRDKGVT